jgi:hypothetical protein
MFAHANSQPVCLQSLATAPNLGTLRWYFIIWMAKKPVFKGFCQKKCEKSVTDATFVAQVTADWKHASPQIHLACPISRVSSWVTDFAFGKLANFFTSFGN